MRKSWLKSFESISKSEEYRNLLKNFGFLAVVQAAQYVLPLVTLPYLMLVLGPDPFGHVMFAQALIQYFITTVEYGFNFSATKQVALNRTDPVKLSQIFSSVLVLRALLSVACFIILVTLVFSLGRFNTSPAIYLLSFTTVLGTVIFPNWLFQGLEKMKYITIVNVSSKAVSTVCIFVFITSPSDVLLVPLIIGLSSVVPSLMGLFYALQKFPVKFSVPPVRVLVNQLKEGWFVFLASISGSMYAVSNTFILGLVFNNVYAGYYAFAEKIIRACTALLIPLNNALFPLMSRKMKETPEQGRIVFRKMFAVLISITVLASLALFFGTDLLKYVISQDFYPSIELLKILSPLIAIVAVNNAIGFQFILTTGLERKYLSAVFIAGLLNIFFCLTLSPLISYRSAAFSLVIAELFICLSFLYYGRSLFLIRKQQLNLRLK